MRAAVSPAAVLPLRAPLLGLWESAGDVLRAGVRRVWDPYRIPPDVAYKLGQLERDPILFMHRYGCVVLLAVVIVLGIIGLLFDVPNPKR